MSQIDEAQSIVAIVSVQNEYSLRHRLPEWGVDAAPQGTGPNTAGTLAASAERGMAFSLWSPLNGMGQAKDLGVSGAAVARIADELSVSPQRLALAWLLSKGEHVFPIPGASRKMSIEDSAQAAELTLTVEQIAELDAG